MTRIDPEYLDKLLGATLRLYLATIGHEDLNGCYHRARTVPENDEHLMLTLLEEARDAWRPIRRRWRDGGMVPKP